MSKVKRPGAKRPRPAPAGPPLRTSPIDARAVAIVAAVLIVATLALVIYARLRLADVPLERDEGEYAYAGQLILDGVPPYAEAYNMKFPGAYYAYAAIMTVFGQSAWGIRVGLLLVNVATAALVFAIGRRLLGRLGGATAACIFAVFAVDRWSMAVFAHATHFVALAATAGLLVLMRGMQSGRALTLVAAGALTGLAVVMKQHAIAFAPLAIGLAAWSARGASAPIREAGRRGAWVVAGLGCSFGGLVALLAAQGVLGRFWFWTFEYARTYVSQVPFAAADDVLVFAFNYISQANLWLWIASLAGLGMLFVRRWPANTRTTLGLWTMASALAVVPGFYFRSHYFIVLMPAAGLLAGAAVAGLHDALARRTGALTALIVSVALPLGLIGGYAYREAHYLFSMGHTELVRSLYATNPFLESPEIARYIAERTAPDDRIAVLGSEPQIFFYAKRRSATGYLYAYPLMEAQPFAARMQQEFRQEVEAARPAFVVFIGVPTSWGARPESDQGILEWANKLAGQCYELTGLADIDPAGGATIRWDADSRAYKPRFPSQVWILRRTATICG